MGGATSAEDDVPAEAPRDTRAAVSTLVTGMSAPIFVVMPTLLVGTLAVSLRQDLGFEETALGVAIAMPRFVAALSSALVGRVVERVGPSTGLRIGAAGSASVLLGIGVFAQSWGSLVPFLGIAGVVSTIAVPASDLWITRAVPVHRHGLALGVMRASRSGAALIAGVAVPVVATTIGWRWAFLITGLLALTTLMTIPTRRTAGRGRPSVSRDGDVTLGPLVVLATGFGFGAAGAAALIAFSVSTAVQAGMSEAAAGWLFGVGAVVGIVSRLLLGYWADLRSGGHLRAVGILFVGGSVAYLLMATNETTMIFFAMPLAFGTAWGWTGLFVFSMVRANPNAPAAATAITRTGGFVGGVVGPLSFGFLAHHSYSLAWTVVAGWSLMGAAVVLLGRRLVLREMRERG